MPAHGGVKVVAVIPVNRPVEFEQVNKLRFPSTRIRFEPPLRSQGVWLTDAVEGLLQESVVVEGKHDVMRAKPQSEIPIQRWDSVWRCLNEYALDRRSCSDYRSAAMCKVFVGAQEPEVVLPMAVREYAFQVDRGVRIQRAPLFDLLFQWTVPTGVPKRVLDVLSDAFKKTIAQRQARRRREASAEYEQTTSREVHVLLLSLIVGGEQWGS